MVHAWRPCSRRLALALLALATLPGCVALPPLPPRTESHALPDVADTPLARVAAASVLDALAGLPAAGAEPPSGLRLMVGGESAFNLRVALVRHAVRSIDVQTYAWALDGTGRGLLRELRDAAARGVRVRLLVDDLHAGEVEPLLAALAAHPGVEVRLFNPLPLRSSSLVVRVLGSLHAFERINRRMHNKLLVADNALAIAGGRNVADEYFMADDEANFIDLDVLAAGPVVPELSRVFDRYWNHVLAYPIQALRGRNGTPHAMRAEFDAAVAQGTTRLGERQRDWLGQPSPVLQLAQGVITLDAAPARVLADSPDKSRGDAGPTRTVADEMLAELARTRREALILTPYFIPADDAMSLLRALGPGRVTLVTNSLGSTDEPLTYGGYEHHRRELLQLGVALHELGPVLSRDSGRVAYFGRAQGRLHAKAMAIDGERLFVGSLNLDPRSSHVNTEVGLLIESPALARQIGTLVRQRLAAGSYRLRLAAGGERIEWVETDWQGRETVHADEPHDSLWVRLRLWLLQRFVSDELL